jgi:hypothetical protein
VTHVSTAAEPAPRNLRAARAERRLQRLDELADMGMEVAGELRRQVLERAGPGEALGLAFDRVCRAVRLTLMLQEKLEQEHDARAREAAAQAAAARAAEVERKVRAVRRTVRNILDVEIEADETLDDCSLHGGMLDSLDRESGDQAFLDRPLGEIVARICADLGLRPDWSLWEDEPWAVEAAGAEPPTEPREPPRQAPPPDPDLAPEAFLADVLRRTAAERRAPP